MSLLLITLLNNGDIITGDNMIQVVLSTFSSKGVKGIDEGEIGKGIKRE